jgi:hypothetical protein
MRGRWASRVRSPPWLRVARLCGRLVAAVWSAAAGTGLGAHRRTGGWPRPGRGATWPARWLGCPPGPMRTLGPPGGAALSLRYAPSQALPSPRDRWPARRLRRPVRRQQRVGSGPGAPARPGRKRTGAARRLGVVPGRQDPPDRARAIHQGSTGGSQGSLGSSFQAARERRPYGDPIAIPVHRNENGSASATPLTRLNLGADERNRTSDLLITNPYGARRRRPAP